MSAKRCYLTLLSFVAGATLLALTTLSAQANLIVEVRVASVENAQGATWDAHHVTILEGTSGQIIHMQVFGRVLDADPGTGDDYIRTLSANFYEENSNNPTPPANLQVRGDIIATITGVTGFTQTGWKAGVLADMNADGDMDLGVKPVTSANKLSEFIAFAPAWSAGMKNVDSTGWAMIGNELKYLVKSSSAEAGKVPTVIGIWPWNNDPLNYTSTAGATWYENGLVKNPTTAMFEQSASKVELSSAPIPEPSTFVLLLTACLGVLGLRLRKK